MKTILLILTFASFLPAMAQTKHEHREHGAHVHGAAKLSIAFDGSSGQVEFEGAAEGVLGFEHAAKSAKDKATLDEIRARFQKAESFVQFDLGLDCKFQPEKIDQVMEGGKHSDFVANYKVTCAKPILGSKLKLDFSSFPHLNDIDVTLLIGEVQKSLELKGKPAVIDLK